MTRDKVPRIHLVSRPSFDVDEFLRFLNDHGLTWSRTAGASAAEEAVEAAGRLCYMSFGTRQSARSNSEYIDNLIREGHESVLEHASWSFVLTGVSRSFTHQFVRHRVGFAFSQLSQQYYDQSETAAVEPRFLGVSQEAAAKWRQAVESSQQAYRDILRLLEESDTENPLIPHQERERRRAIRSAARSVLPEATESKVFFTANARAIRDFLALRGCILGDEEMRVVCAALLECIRREAPSLFKDFVIEDVDGLPVVRQVSI
jgi:thymidylate synthase (FAD)